VHKQKQATNHIMMAYWNVEGRGFGPLDFHAPTNTRYSNSRLVIYEHHPQHTSFTFVLIRAAYMELTLKEPGMQEKSSEPRDIYRYLSMCNSLNLSSSNIASLRAIGYLHGTCIMGA
jgi:hypothetical protein